MAIRLLRIPAQPDSKFITQSIRITETENKRLKRAAKKQGKSFNAWAVHILNDAAAVALNPPPAQENNGTSSK